MKSILKRFKSKTYWKEIVAGALVIIESHYGLLQEYLGEHYGWSYIVIMLAGFIIRELTKTPISDK